MEQEHYKKEKQLMEAALKQVSSIEDYSKQYTEQKIDGITKEFDTAFGNFTDLAFQRITKGMNDVHERYEELKNSTEIPSKYITRNDGGIERLDIHNDSVMVHLQEIYVKLASHSEAIEKITQGVKAVRDGRELNSECANIGRKGYCRCSYIHKGFKQETFSQTRYKWER